jgi:predicted Zn-dependent peptidase
MLHTFSNQLRLVYFEAQTEVSHLGVMVKAGSRDELHFENGLAHFIEHGFFKGTITRRPVNILSRMDSVGGELNAYTTKEDTVIYTSFLNEFFSRGLELLADILLNSQFPIKEINKEKDVIVDEINMYRDSPSEDIMDRFDALLYPNHPLGTNILGTEELVRSFTPKHIQDFLTRNYSNENIVVSYTGPLPYKKVKSLMEKFFSLANFSGGVRHRERPIGQTTQKETVERRLNQVHCVIGKTALSINDRLRLPFTLINNILGGPGMNSRLNLNVREKYGFCYSIDSGFHAYSDTGAFNIYFGTDEKNFDKTFALVQKELARFIKSPLTEKQTHLAKIQLKGQIALSQQNLQNRMLANAKSVMLFNEPNPLQKSLREIDAIKADQLNEAAYTVFGISDFHQLIYR